MVTASEKAKNIQESLLFYGPSMHLKPRKYAKRATQKYVSANTVPILADKQGAKVNRSVGLLLPLALKTYNVNSARVLKAVGQHFSVFLQYVSHTPRGCPALISLSAGLACVLRCCKDAPPLHHSHHDTPHRL